MSINDYLLSKSKRADEKPLDDMDPSAYQKALFYMYGACEGLRDDKLIVHNLLRKDKVWDGSEAQAASKLGKQIVTSLTEDAEQDLSQMDNIIRFLNNNSKYGKNVREIEEIGETLSCTLYKIVGSEDEVVLKVPKAVVPGSENAGFLDIVY